MRDTVRIPAPVADLSHPRHENERLRKRIRELEQELAQLKRDPHFYPSFVPSEWHVFTDQDEAENAGSEYPGAEMIPVRFPSNYADATAAWIVEVTDRDGEFMGILGAV